MSTHNNISLLCLKWTHPYLKLFVVVFFCHEWKKWPKILTEKSRTFYFSQLLVANLTRSSPVRMKFAWFFRSSIFSWCCVFVKGSNRDVEKEQVAAIYFHVFNQTSMTSHLRLLISIAMRKIHRFLRISFHRIFFLFPLIKQYQSKSERMRIARGRKM